MATAFSHFYANSFRPVEEHAEKKGTRNYKTEE